MAIPKPQPKDWLAAAADELRLGDRAVLTILQASYKNVNEILKGLPDGPSASPGNLIYRAQLERTRRELLNEQAKLFDKLGDVTSARRLRSASRAAKLSAAADNTLLRLVGQDALGKLLYDGAKITSQRTVETLLARAKLSAVPLSERIYNTKSWMNKRLDRLITQTMAGGLNAAKFAKVARDWFAPSVPGGTRYAAMRLARTEINNAFHATSIVYAQDKPWVNEMEWHLSKSHPKPDVCNPVAAASPYPVSEVPRKPHPQCMCYVTEVTPDEDDWIDRYVRGDFDSYLDSEMAKADAALGIKPLTPKAPTTKKAQQKPAPAADPVQVTLPSAAPADDTPTDTSALEDRVRKAYVEAADKPGDLVSLAVLRESLSDVSKKDLDRVLLKLDRERSIQLDADPDRRNLTTKAKDAAIPLGGEDMHLIAISREKLGDLAPPEPTGPHGYKPDAWEKQTGNEARIEDLVEELSRQRALKSLSPDEIRTMAEELINETTGDNEVVFKNGSHFVRFTGSLTEAQQQTFLANVDTMQERIPLPHKLNITVAPSTDFEVGVGGETTLGTGSIRINEDTLRRTVWPGMPISSRVSSVLYVLAHEWGHALSPREDARNEHIHNDAVSSGGMTAYGRTTAAEGYAEALAEWSLSKGRTTNPAALAYAKFFKWGERFGLH